MRHVASTVLLAVLVLSLSNCGPKIMVPPKIDLFEHEVVGIIEFESESEGKLGPFATAKFLEWVRKDQGSVRIVELGTEADILDELGRDRLDREAYRELAEKYEIATVFVGGLDISDVRPDITITPGFGYMEFSAEVDAAFSARMVETATGASLWNGSSSATQKVGGVSVFGGKHFSFDAKDPDKAYGRLVEELVKKATRDFRVTWERL